VTQADVNRPKEFGYADADIVELTTAAGTAAKFANCAHVRYLRVDGPPRSGYPELTR